MSNKNAAKRLNNVQPVSPLLTDEFTVDVHENASALKE